MRIPFRRAAAGGHAGHRFDGGGVPAAGNRCALRRRARLNCQKPVLRGWLHVLWFAASLVFGTLLLARAHGAMRTAASAIYASSVTAMFGVSALYHRGNRTAGWKRRLQRLDHGMIFFPIAGTAFRP